MARPSQLVERRRELLPIVARTFAELGYRRTTTAELARRCDVQETILYRLWPDKKAMFIAAIGYVYDLSTEIWRKLLKDHNDGQTPAERLLNYESRHQGEFGYYRIVFAGLSEADDPDIRAALVRMYRRFQRWIEKQIADHRDGTQATTPSPALAAWAVVGVGTVANILRELEIVGTNRRQDLIADVGRYLLDGEIR
ncbi:MAG: TetR/AcrR family transcriptional regulator [Planctomycetota bacterium]